MKKKVLLIVIMMLAMAVVAACSRGDNSQPHSEPDFDFNVNPPIEVAELSPDQLLAVHFLDVGDGDAILLVQGDYSMLVDAGSSNMGTRVFQYLRSQGINNLNYIVNTHPFEDHLGGFPDVMRRMTVQNALIPNVFHSSQCQRNFFEALETAATQNLNVSAPFAGEVFYLGDAQVTVLSPRMEDSFGTRAVPNYSIVLRVAFGDTSFLLMGDAMREVEAILLDNPSNVLSSDVLKVARHGDSSATTSGFLDAVNPSIAVISAERGSFRNTTEVNNRLANAHVHTFDTGNNGNIVITSDGVNISVTVDRDTR